MIGQFPFPQTSNALGQKPGHYRLASIAILESAPSRAGHRDETFQDFSRLSKLEKLEIDRDEIYAVWINFFQLDTPRSQMYV